MQTQTYVYDDYGNLTSTSKLGQTVSLPTSTSTNRLTSLGYDASGNVIASGTQHYDYDSAGMLNAVRLGTNLQPRVIYAYTADDERLFSFDVSTGTTHWTLRGLDNKVLRDFRQQGSTWSVERDYVYRDGLLLAALKSAGTVEHYTLDHLGTPRLITDAAGHKLGYHVYWPFGEEWTSATVQEGSPLKFTGHERDADPTGGSAPLDYMHARYYGAGWGRFLGVDPVLGNSQQPQSWNRYVYVRNNPIGRIDPTGLDESRFCILCGGTQPEPVQGQSLSDANVGRTHITITVTAKDPGWLSALVYRTALSFTLGRMHREFTDAERAAMMGKNFIASYLMRGGQLTRVHASPLIIGPVGPVGVEVELVDGFYQAEGSAFKFSQYYYEKLWGSGRPAPFLAAQEVYDTATTIMPDEIEGFYRYSNETTEMVYNPTTGEVWHMQPIR
jgi:RHS repeat-associated protein